MFSHVAVSNEKPNQLLLLCFCHFRHYQTQKDSPDIQWKVRVFYLLCSFLYQVQ